jgi:uncharacterized protein (DUF1330 family)
MPAYVIVEIAIHSPQEYEEYKKLSLPSLQPFQGKFIVRGGKIITLESDWNPERIVILEFPDKDRALEWYKSDIYCKAKDIRLRTASTKMIIVEGISQASTSSDGFTRRENEKAPLKEFN